jgi:hypothetical protein
MLALGESGRGEQLVSSFRRWLDHYLTRSQDRDIFRDTPFALDPKDDANAAV